MVAARANVVASNTASPTLPRTNGSVGWSGVSGISFLFEGTSPMIEKNWLDLKKPDELEVKVSEYNTSQAVVAVGPFERGFGVTIGNALRRVLLSSLQVLLLCHDTTARHHGFGFRSNLMKNYQNSIF